MKRISLLRAILLCRKYQRLSESERERIRQGRLRELVQYAREKSPYYREHLRDVGERFALDELPPTNKRELMSRFDDWPTDRSLRLSEIHAFMQDQDNIGRKFKGKYLVLTTSGSTGHPLVVLCDQTVNNVMGAISATRALARKEDLRAFLKAGKKTIGIFATGGFYLGNSAVRSRLLAMPWKKRQIAVTSALLPIPAIVAELNAFQPAMLGGYPTVLQLLIEEQQSGRLHIQPVLIMTGGEYLSDRLRQQLTETFQCYVQTSYSCTEGGTIACECQERHFHINDDWVIVEPVDKDNRPVPDGVQSDKILLTNLFNYTQPFIRYEVSDRVVMHHEPCACGNPAPWLTLEGRTDDVIVFREGEREIPVVPLALSSVLDEVEGIRRFQMVKHPNNHLELRLEPAAGYKKEEVYATASQSLKGFLRTHGILQVAISLSEEGPKPHPRSGKFKQILNVS